MVSQHSHAAIEEDAVITEIAEIDSGTTVPAPKQSSASKYASTQEKTMPKLDNACCHRPLSSNHDGPNNALPQPVEPPLYLLYTGWEPLPLLQHRQKIDQLCFPLWTLPPCRIVDLQMDVDRHRHADSVRLDRQQALYASYNTVGSDSQLHCIPSSARNGRSKFS